MGSGVGALSISAKNNGGTGGGGNIEVAYLTTLSISGPISVSAGTQAGSTGAGGTINIHNIDQLSTTTAVLTANGGGSGLAGSITLDQSGTGLAMDLDGAVISASGDPAGSGSGNNIDISSASNMTMSGAKLNADAAGAGNSFGGSIHITTAGQVVDLSQPNTFLSAKGATNGAGGNVIISNTSSFDVNTVITVDAGSGTLGNLTIFDGIIQLNAVECRQWHTGYAYPVAYWNCVNQTTPSATDQIPPSVMSNLPNNLTPNVLKMVGTTLYVQIDASQFNKFFGASLNSGIGGYTFSVTGQTRPFVYLHFRKRHVSR